MNTAWGSHHSFNGLYFQELVQYLNTVDLIQKVCWSERLALEGSFAGSVQCIMGLRKCKQTAVKTSNMAATWIFEP